MSVNRKLYRYDRSAVRLVLETQGREEALKRWPVDVVDPIARVMGLIGKYRPSNVWNPEWASLLGTKPDSVLAGELGIPTQTVRIQRTKLGIRTVDFVAQRKARRALLAGISNEELANTAVDVLAAKYHVAQHEIALERRRRDVCSITKTGKRRKVQARNELRRVAVFAIKDKYPDATLEAIGKAIGCTREYVRQLLYEREAVAS